MNKDLEDFLVDIDSLIPLENNPRRGNVEAIMSSLKEFGQVTPIVVKPNGDGTATVIAGNHRLEAAKRLGWTRIAVVHMDVDDSKAVAFALADNRTSDLGDIDNAALMEMLEDVHVEYPELFDNLGWDEFEIAALDEGVRYAEKMGTDIGTGYVAPVLIDRDEIDSATIERPNLADSISATVDKDGSARLEAKNNENSKEAVSLGVTATDVPGSAKAVIQYTLVFDNPDQQKQWYDFIRYLRSSPVYGGETTAQRLMEFIDAHTEI